ncbi:DUF6114 domain-containing protein [Antribacter gilvus]|uniref:DUF6114 domain-containing protein n=1 Tax=Antribacter gilvus TaxID=2304675 RepID=UPI000F7A97F0|nr:DUF6114 domain-containing protein [Antribacter gilvus]
MLLSPGGRTRVGRAGPRERFAARRQDFRSWRLQRPFVGGVLIVLSGLEMLLAGPIDLGYLRLEFLVTGFQAVIIPVVLVAAGVLMLLMPAQRVFYSVVALATAVYSLAGLNLGGWFVGFALGVAGGLVAISWAPRQESPPEPGVGRRRTAGERSAAVVLAGALATQGLAAAPLPAATCWDPIDWLPIITCPTPSPTPTPTPTPAPTASASPSPSARTTPGAGENPVGDVVDGVGDAVEGVVDGLTAEEAVGIGEVVGEDGEIQAEEAPEVVTEAFQLELGECVTLEFGGTFDLNVLLPGDCGERNDANTYSLPGDLRSRDLHPLTGLTGIGLDNVPVTGGDPNGDGRRDVLRLSASELTVDGFWLKTYAYDDGPGLAGKAAGTETDAGAVELRGNVQMYVSSLHADLPDGTDLLELAQKIVAGASVVEILLGLVDAQMGLVGATSDVQVWRSFREQVWTG